MGVEVSQHDIQITRWYGIQGFLKVVEKLVLVSSAGREGWSIAGKDV
jgi:hypothetical protein